MLEECGDGPKAQQREGLEKFFNLTSASGAVLIFEHIVATYDYKKDPEVIPRKF